MGAMRTSFHQVFLTIFILFLLPCAAVAQCTDSDSDGYYYEEGCGTPRDCNDSNPDIYPGAVETCNGFDDDCDSLQDEGCDSVCDDPRKPGSDERITFDATTSEFPSLVWTGDGYGIAWQDSAEITTIWFAILDALGNAIGSEVQITGDFGYVPSLVWTGSEFGIGWEDYREGNGEIYFVRLDLVGNKIGTDVRVTFDGNDSWYPSLIWTGYEYGVSWCDVRNGNFEIYFARLDSLGNKIGSDIRVTEASSDSYIPSLVWNGEGYAISWIDYRDGNGEVYFVRVDASGSKIGSDVRVTYDGAESYSPSLTWTGSAYGILWEEYRDGNAEIYSAILDPAGNKIGTDRRVTENVSESYAPSLEWTGSEYGVSWHDFREGNGEVYFARLDASGNKVSSDVRITIDESSSGYPLLIWTGNEYAVSWQDGRDGNNEIYFARVSCCDDDRDNDGYNECDDCDDNDDAINPGVDEFCDGIDDDCDGTIDDGISTDVDEDGHYSIDSCWSPHDDCDDLDDTVYPGAPELCSAKDNDCDGTIDNKDFDNDGYIDEDCIGGDDCDDDNSLIHPGAEEICDFLDNDCNEIIDEGFDEDNDGYSVCEDDCNDGNGSIYPGAQESCNGLDDNCNGMVDEGLSRDADEDGHYTLDSCISPHDDCNDLNPSIHPDAPEICNAYDDNCNRILDEGCVTSCDKPEVVEPAIKASDLYASNLDPSLIWTGNEFGVSWNDNRHIVIGYDEIYFSRFHSSWNKIGSDIRISHGGKDSEYSSIIWTGREYGFSWQDYRDGNWEIYFNTYNPFTDITGGDARITRNFSSSRYSSLAWTGSEYGICWVDSIDGNPEIYFVRIDPFEGVVGSETRITYDSAYSWSPSLVWAGDGYGVAWQDGRTGSVEIYFARLDSSGQKIGSDIRITYDEHASLSAALVWTGSEYGLAWREDYGAGSYGVKFVKLDSEGRRVGFIKGISYNVESFSLIWTGSEYGISWERKGDNTIDIYFARFDSSGNKIGSDIMVPTSAMYSRNPSLAWTGSDYAVAYEDRPPFASFIHMIGCCRGEFDGDADGWCWLDCNDQDDSMYPAAPEMCDSKDNDCNGLVDDKDIDEDGFIDADCSGGNDCDDDNPQAYPDADEILCNGIDEACNGIEDDAPDGDNDGFDACGISDAYNPDGLAEDCNDASSSTNIEASDTCNGRDDDCDGFPDNGCDAICDGPGKSMDDVRVTYAYVSHRASLVWTGTEYGIAYEDYRNFSQIYFSRLDSGGQKIGSDARITFEAGGKDDPSLVWTGNEYAVSWSDSRDWTYPGYGDEIYFSIFDSSGNKIGSDVRISYDTDNSYKPSLVWTGTEYGVAWQDSRHGNDEIYFRRIDRTGRVIGNEQRITYDYRSSSDASLVWTGENYAISWGDSRHGLGEVYFVRISKQGIKIGQDIRITYDSSNSGWPSLYWAGANYSVAWTDARDGNNEIYFALLNKFGNRVTEDRRISHNSASSLNPDLAWTGSEYGISWSDTRDGNYEIYFARVDSSGNKIDGEMMVSDGLASSSFWPSLVWNGKQYGFVWEDYRDGIYAIYFTQFECNQAPDANAGDDGQSECASQAGAMVTLNGSASTDTDSTPGTNDDIVFFEWFEFYGSPDEILLGTGEILDVVMPLGNHLITLKVMDSVGQTDTDEVIKTVVDTIPPDISFSLEPDTLWPPNHRMVEVEATVTAIDICSTLSVTLSSVTSDEPDDAPGNGDGHTVNDIQEAETGTADFNFKLRAERSGTGDGRMYSVTYYATDISGNSASAGSSVSVPHDMDGTTEPLNLSLSETSLGTLVRWNRIENAVDYNVIRGRLSNIRENEEAIDLGEVVCIEWRSLDESTGAREDAEMPDAGEAFFYLAEYNYGMLSSYGTETASKPRAASSGSCP